MLQGMATPGMKKLVPRKHMQTEHARHLLTVLYVIYNTGPASELILNGTLEWNQCTITVLNVQPGCMLN
jgi:hypothetical protein